MMYFSIQWVHVAVTVDAIAGANPLEAVIYIDGQEVGWNRIVQLSPFYL